MVNQRTGPYSSAGRSDSGMGSELQFPALLTSHQWTVLRGFSRPLEWLFYKKDYQHLSATDLGIPGICSQKSSVSPSNSALLSSDRTAL